MENTLIVFCVSGIACTCIMSVVRVKGEWVCENEIRTSSERKKQQKIESNKCNLH